MRFGVFSIDQNLSAQCVHKFNKNLDFGTDHGGATVSFVSRDQVTVGVFGRHPSLKKFLSRGLFDKERKHAVLF